MNYAEKHIAHLLLHKTFIKFHIYENRNGVFRQKKLSQDVIIFSFVYHLYFNIILILFQGFAALNREICRSRTLIILGYGFKNYNYFNFLTK